MFACGAPQDRAIDQRRAADAGADGQHDGDAHAAGSARQRLAEERRIGVVDEPHRRAEAGNERAHDIVPLPTGECVEVLDPPARFVEGTGAAETDARERTGVYAGLGHRLVDGAGQPREPRIEARLDVRCDGPPRPHGATRIDRADRDLGAADIDAQRKTAHRLSPSRLMPAAASSSQRQTASPCSHRKDAGSAGVTRRSASRASGSCLAAPETRSRMRRARRMSPRPSVSPWRTEASFPPAWSGRAIARQASQHGRRDRNPPRAR